MNNNLYHWHAEQMVKHEMEEVKRAAEQARLLKEAGFSSPSLLVRVIDSLRNLLIARKKSFQNRHSGASQTYQSTSDKLSR